MFPNISIEKAHLLKQKIEEIKNTLDKEIITHSYNGINIEISVLGNIKEISNPLNKNLEEIIPIINEATAKARQDYEIKQAQLLQKEMMNLM
jgi:hypothetical protein